MEREKRQNNGEQRCVNVVTPLLLLLLLNQFPSFCSRYLAYATRHWYQVRLWRNPTQRRRFGRLCRYTQWSLPEPHHRRQGNLFPFHSHTLFRFLSWVCIQLLVTFFFPLSTFIVSFFCQFGIWFSRKLRFKWIYFLDLRVVCLLWILMGFGGGFFCRGLAIFWKIIVCVGWLYCTVVYVGSVFGTLKGKKMFGALQRNCLLNSLVGSSFSFWFMYVNFRCSLCWFVILLSIYLMLIMKFCDIIHHACSYSSVVL